MTMPSSGIVLKGPVGERCVSPALRQG
jgi:hypothetical protein